MADPIWGVYLYIAILNILLLKTTSKFGWITAFLTFHIHLSLLESNVTLSLSLLKETFLISSILISWIFPKANKLSSKVLNSSGYVWDFKRTYPFFLTAFVPFIMIGFLYELANICWNYLFPYTDWLGLANLYCKFKSNSFEFLRIVLCIRATLIIAKSWSGYIVSDFQSYKLYIYLSFGLRIVSKQRNLESMILKRICEL